jgi:hypothetical protein
MSVSSSTKLMGQLHLLMSPFHGRAVVRLCSHYALLHPINLFRESKMWLANHSPLSVFIVSYTCGEE